MCTANVFSSWNAQIKVTMVHQGRLNAHIKTMPLNSHFYVKVCRQVPHVADIYIYIYLHISTYIYIYIHIYI